MFALGLFIMGASCYAMGHLNQKKRVADLQTEIDYLQSWKTAFENKNRLPAREGWRSP